MLFTKKKLTDEKLIMKTSMERACDLYRRVLITERELTEGETGHMSEENMVRGTSTGHNI